MHRKNRTFSGQNDSLTASNSVKNLESTLRINSDLHVDPAENVGNRYLEVSPQRQKWYARRSGRNNPRTVILPASRCYGTSLFGEENGTNTSGIKFSTGTEFPATTANRGCSDARQLQEKISNVRSLAEQHANERNPLGFQRATCPKPGPGA